MSATDTSATDTSATAAEDATRVSGDPSRRYWNEATQTMPREQLRALQDERLHVAVERAYETVFHQRRFDAIGVTPDDIKGVDDIGKLPLCFKDDLRADEIEHPPVGSYRRIGLNGSVRLTTSTGTTGKPTFALWTAKDLALELELSARANWRMGYRPGQVVVNAHPGYLNGGESFIVADCQHMGILPVSLGPPESIEGAARALRAIEGVKVDHWRLFPASLARFHEAAAQFGIDVDLPPLSGAGPIQQYERMSAGQECISLLGTACGPGKGAHMAEDFAVVEVLDADTLLPAADGRRGLLTVTSLGRDNPMIRYNNEDVVRVEAALCDCGETSRRGFYEGRRKDMVVIGEQIVLPIDVWFEIPVEAEYELVRHKSADRLTVRIEHEPASDLQDRLEARTGVPIVIERVDDGAIARAAFKPSRVVED